MGVRSWHSSGIAIQPLDRKNDFPFAEKPEDSGAIEASVCRDGIVSIIHMEAFLIWSAIGFGGGVGFASFFEWTLHRYLMHRPFGRLEYAFRAHALVHHQTFRADHTYHLLDEKDKATIPMAWWNGPVLILSCALPFLIVSLLTRHWGLVVGAVASFGAYYGAYEYMHWCMHLPKSRRLERSWAFRRLNGHHLLHHRYMHKNFNVVLPLADLCLGTLMLRSKIHFAQPWGPAVPDVQPRVARAA
jgi:hypothetical protein